MQYPAILPSYRKLVNNAVFIRNESLFVVSAAAMSVFQLEHMLQYIYIQRLSILKYILTDRYVNMYYLHFCSSQGGCLSQLGGTSVEIEAPLPTEEVSQFQSLHTESIRYSIHHRQDIISLKAHDVQ